MLFALIKVYARLAIKIYCKKVIINKPDMLALQGPLLFAANHPNSFLDGMILTTLFQEPVYSLARGDAFKNKRFNKLLRWLHLLPVYRTSEGAENLGHNYTTFAACQQVFKRDGVVLIFSEGRCTNEWHLRPLKKGTARLAVTSWEAGIPLKVIPLGFNYSSFRSFGKVVHLNFGETISQSVIQQQEGEGKQFLQFNELVEQQLKQEVYEIHLTDIEKRKKIFRVPTSSLQKYLLALPAVCGLLLHLPLYFMAKKATDIFFDNDHYDSVLTLLLMISYPFYVALLTAFAAYFLGGFWGFFLLFFLPFSAWAWVQFKPTS